FFFFQAEDGIRDLTVTGVQTCALPISSILISRGPPASSASAHAVVRNLVWMTTHQRGSVRMSSIANYVGDGWNVERHGSIREPRSEERRVGKECRSRWSQ